MKLIQLLIILYYVVCVIFTLYCLVLTIIWACKIVVGIAVSMLYWYIFIVPLFYFFPKAVALVFKGILRPGAVLKTLMAPFIGLAVAFLIIAGYHENAFFKSCICVAANWAISITGPITFYASGIFLLLIACCSIFIEDARLTAEDEFWKIMNRYKKNNSFISHKTITPP